MWMVRFRCREKKFWMMLLMSIIQFKPLTIGIILITYDMAIVEIVHR